MLVVCSETCPNQARIVLMSTPARNRWTAVVCRIVCGLTRLVPSVGNALLASLAYCVTTRCIPKRVKGWLARLKKTASFLSRPCTRQDNDVAVFGHNGQVRHLLPLP